MVAGVAKKNRSKPINTKISEKHQQALDLRTAGASYREIASSLGWKSPASAQEAVKKAIAKTHLETSTEALLMDLNNLDDWFKRCTHRLRTTGDLSQIDRMIRIMEKKHQLLGVDSTTLAEKLGKKTTAGGATIVIAPSENAFIEGMMRAVGVDPDSPEAQAYMKKKGPDKGVSVAETSASSPKEIEGGTAPKNAGPKKKKLVVRKKAKPKVVAEETQEEVAVKAEPSEPIIVPTLHDIFPANSVPELRESSI